MALKAADFYLKLKIKCFNLRVSGYEPLVQISGPANFALSEPVNIGLVQESEIFKPEFQHGKPADSESPGKDRSLIPRGSLTSLLKTPAPPSSTQPKPST